MRAHSLIALGFLFLCSCMGQTEKNIESMDQNMGVLAKEIQTDREYLQKLTEIMDKVEGQHLATISKNSDSLSQEISKDKEELIAMIKNFAKANTESLKKISESTVSVTEGIKQDRENIKAMRTSFEALSQDAAETKAFMKVLSENSTMLTQKLIQDSEHIKTLVDQIKVMASSAEKMTAVSQNFSENIQAEYLRTQVILGKMAEQGQLVSKSLASMESVVRKAGNLVPKKETFDQDMSVLRDLMKSSQKLVTGLEEMKEKTGLKGEDIELFAGALKKLREARSLLNFRLFK